MTVDTTAPALAATARKDFVLYYGDQSYYNGSFVLGWLRGGVAERIWNNEGWITATIETINYWTRSRAKPCLDFGDPPARDEGGGDLDGGPVAQRGGPSQ